MDSDADYDSALSRWFSKPAAQPADEDQIGASRNAAGHLEALGQVREWVRKRFNLSAESAIMVSEIACDLPGCPPLETVVAFWDQDRRHHFKLFKQVKEVGFDDLPYTWMKDSLVVPEGFGCECC